MGLELAEQLGWELPDVIFYPTGGGTGSDRDVEGLRRAGGDRLHRLQAAADGRGAGGRLRADRAGLRGGRGARARAGRMPIRLPRAFACRRRSAIS